MEPGLDEEFVAGEELVTSKVLSLSLRSTAVTRAEGEALALWPGWCG